MGSFGEGGGVIVGWEGGFEVIKITYNWKSVATQRIFIKFIRNKIINMNRSTPS